jgi:hypothetical protein
MASDFPDHGATESLVSALRERSWASTVGLIFSVNSVPSQPKKIYDQPTVTMR